MAESNFLAIWQIDDFLHRVIWLWDFPWGAGRAGLKLGFIFPLTAHPFQRCKDYIMDPVPKCLCRKHSWSCTVSFCGAKSSDMESDIYLSFTFFSLVCFREVQKCCFSEARAPKNVKGTSAAGKNCWPGPLHWALRNALLFVPQATSQKLAAQHTAGLTLPQSRHTEGYSSPKPLFRPRGKLKPFILLCSCFAIQKELYYGFYSMLTESQLNSLSQFLGIVNASLTCKGNWLL